MLLTGYSLYLFIPAGCTEQLLLLRISQSAGPAGVLGLWAHWRVPCFCIQVTGVLWLELGEFYFCLCRKPGEA